MGGRLIDYIGQGLAADIPLASDMPARIAAGAASIYYEQDTGSFKFFNDSTVAWVPFVSQTNENIQDMIAAFLTNGAGIALAYNDAGNLLSITCTITQYTDAMAVSAVGAVPTTESIQDMIATFLMNGAGITLTYDDAGNHLTIASTITQYTDAMAVSAVGAIPTTESIQDMLATFLVNGAGVTLTYDDAGNTLTIGIVRPYRVGWFFTTALAASEVILIHTFTKAVTFPGNFAGSLGAVDGTAPGATLAIDVQKNNASVGTISGSVGGVISFASTGGAAVTFAAGDRLKLVGPAVVNTATNVSGTFEGTF